MTIGQFCMRGVLRWVTFAGLRVAPCPVRGAEQNDAGYVLRRAAAAERSRATQPPEITKLTVSHFVRVSDKTDR